MTGHVHAELMEQYAEDARETETPWEYWEVRLPHGCWHSCFSHPTWRENVSYRRKLKTSLERFEEAFDVEWQEDGDDGDPCRHACKDWAWWAWRAAERQARKLDE